MATEVSSIEKPQQVFIQQGIYQPGCLAECLELLSRPLPRDHSLVRDSERVNIVSVHDVITGTGTERSAEESTRLTQAISRVTMFLDEISTRNVDLLGLPILNRLLQIEPDCDEDGVPVEESEDELCLIIAKVLIRIEAVIESRSVLSNPLSAFLCDKEQLMYNKYKLLKSVRFATGTLRSAIHGNNSPSSTETGILCNYASTHSTLAVLNNFSATMSSAVGVSMKTTLQNKDALFLNKVLISELVETQVEVCRASRDWSQAASVLDQAIELIDSESEEDIIKALMRLLLVDDRVLLAMTDSEEVARKLQRFTVAVKSRKVLDSAITDTVPFIEEAVAEASK